MSFNSVTPETFKNNNNKKQMKEAFDNKPSIKINSNFQLPKAINEELKKAYSFTLKEHTKKKLDNLAIEQGFKSTSSFLEELITQL